MKKYGNIEYYVAEISRKHDSSKIRHITLKTGWLIKSAGAEGNFTSIQSQTQGVSHFPRTPTVIPLERYIKQNYAEEAKNIAEYAKRHKTALSAPNGKITNLTPVQWLAVRLQSFKVWFGDWENDPANASKVVDENGANVLVAVKLDVGVGCNPMIVVNRISSLYGKEKIETLLKHPALYVNTAKASRWVVDRGLQLPTVTNLSAGSNGRIQTPTDLLKYKIERGLSFSLSVPSILDAAPTGRMAGEEKMQRLLNYARKEADAGGEHQQHEDSGGVCCCGG